jgi:hypothetical protein
MDRSQDLCPIGKITELQHTFTLVSPKMQENAMLSHAAEMVIGCSRDPVL